MKLVAALVRRITVSALALGFVLAASLVYAQLPASAASVDSTVAGKTDSLRAIVPDVADSSHAAAAVHSTPKKLDVKEMLFHHIVDNHDWPTSLRVTATTHPSRCTCPM
jgi:hypothetical protein